MVRANFVTDHSDKPILDERTFHQLLEAAHVLQEHNRKMRDLEAIMESERRREREAASEAPARPTEQITAPENERRNGDYTLTLAEIVEAQRQIQVRNLDLDKTMAVVAERVAHITTAQGAGIGILDGKKVRYRAGIGSSALPEGSEVPLKSAVCAASIRTGQVIRCEDVNTEVLFDPEPCRQRGILSLLAVPIYQDGGIVGGLELYFDKAQGYAEQDIHTCQLMAGLVTEALGRDAEAALKKSMAEERSSMLAAMEKLQPKPSAPEQHELAASAGANGNSSGGSAGKTSCWKCGNTLPLAEQFCGKCGSPSSATVAARSGETLRPANQVEIGTAKIGEDAAANLFAPVTHHAQETAGISERAFNSSVDDYAMSASAVSTHPTEDEDRAAEIVEEEKGGEEKDGAETQAIELSQAQPEEAIVWSSAARARDFLESLSPGPASGAVGRFWRSRRGDFYLAVALILVAVVIRWGVLSNQTTVASGTHSASASRRKPAPDEDLSTFDKLLIGLGLAEAPEAPEYNEGNPDTEVWLDLQTALYYCPGSDLYGKTAKGKLATQRDAQLDQFEPAYRKPCK